MNQQVSEREISSHSEFLPGAIIPESVMFGHPSRFKNIWQPTTERILLEEERLKDQTITASIRPGTTGTFLSYRPEGKRAKLHLAVETFRHGRVLDLGESLLYDARYVFNDNIAHLLGNHTANLGFAKRYLGVEPSDCTVVLGKGTSQMAHRYFDFLGFETIETNRAVRGNLLQVALDFELQTYSLIPFIPELEPEGVERGGVEKLFVSRSTSRKISNEDEIWPILEERGYERFYFEDIPLAQQWALIRDASYIVATHGAALGYLSAKAGVENGADFQLLEIFSPGLVADIFRKTSAIVGGRWMCCRGKVTSEFAAAVEESGNVKAMDAADFELHPETFLQAMDEGNF